MKAQAKQVLDKVLNVSKEFTNSLNVSNHKFVENALKLAHNPTPKSELFPYTYYDVQNKIFFCDNGTKGFAFACNPIVGVDSNIYKQISLLFDDQLPLGGVLQILLIASDDIEAVLKAWVDARVRRDDIYQKLEKYKLENYYKYNQSFEHNFRHRNYKLYFFYSELPSKSQKELKSTLEFREKLRSILDSIGVVPQDVEEMEFLSIVKEIVNYPEFKEEKCNKYEPLGDQITDLSTNLLVEKDGILHSNGEYESRCYQVKTYPETGFSIGRMIDLLGDSGQDNMQIPARFMVSYMVANNLPDSKQEALKAKGDLVIKQANSGIAAFTSGIEEEGKEWSKIKNEHLKKQERFLTTSLVTVLTSKRDLIGKCEQNLVSLWRKNDMLLKGAKYFQLPSLLSICPFLPSSGLFSTMCRFNLARTALSSEPKALMPIACEWKGTKNGGMLVTGRKGQLFAWNSFERGSNYNVSVIGESGSGKSVKLQDFVMSHLALGAKVFVIDIGRSFEKTCKIMGGDFIHFGSGSQISINPFIDIPDNEKEIKLDPKSFDIKSSDSLEMEPDLAQDSLNMLKFIIRKMAAPKGGTTDYQDALIAMSVSETWNKYKNASTIDRLAEVLKTKGDRGKDLSVMLYEYTKQGSYGRFFAGKDNIKFNKDLTVLEFEELRERPDLGGVIMQMLSIQIVQQVYLGNRKQKFIILFDEAWYALLHFPQLLASMSKTVRKYNGALVLGTQSLTDYYGSDEGSGMSSDDKARATTIENMSWRVFLKQKADSAERASRMGLDKAQINTIKSLETVKNHYSESLIYQSEKEYFVSRLMLDPFSETLYSSNPEIFSSVNKLISEGFSTADAVETIMQRTHGK